MELIAEIHKTCIWSVVVTVGGNISKPEKTDFIVGGGSYIILIPDGKYESVETEIHGLVFGQYKFYRIWNSESRFVVAGANEISMSQQTDIFDFLSAFRIYNCIIVSPEHYVIDKEYSRPINVNDVDTGVKLGVYTWFPYLSSDRCTEVKDIILQDSWVISAQGHFTKNIDLFPRKINKSLKGCPLKAVIRHGNNYVTTKYFYHTYANGSVKRDIGGLEIELLLIILQQMNMTYVYVPTPEGFENGQVFEIYLVRTLIAKKAHIALGDVTTRFLLFSLFDITNCHIITRVRWYVPCSVKYPRWSSIFRILSAELWLVLIISIVIVAISAKHFGRYSWTSEWQGYKTLTSSLTNVWAVILGLSVSTMPRTPSLRSLFLAWVCFSLAFSTVFQAFLTTFLIDSGYKPPIRNMDELFASGIKLSYSPNYNHIFKIADEKEKLNVHRNRLNCPSGEVCLNWARYQKNVSLLLSDIVAEMLYAVGDFIGENSEPLLCRLEDGVVFTTGQTMVMFYGDPLLRRITEIIDRVFEAGIYNYWISLTFNKYKLLSKKIALVHPLDGYYSFNLYHMQPAFFLLLIGWCLSAFGFIVEMFYKSLLTITT